MVKLNLLPWRETRRKEKQQHFIIGLSAALIFVLSSFVCIHVEMTNQKIFQMKRNTMLQNEITLQDQTISAIKRIDEKTNQIIDKVNYINTLQKMRLDTLDLLNQLARAIPSTVFLTKLTRIDQKIVIEGRTQNSAALSEFMQNMESETLFQAPVLETMKTPDDTSIENIKNNDKIQLFTFHIQQRNTN